jgi:hypothetical protein
MQVCGQEFNEASLSYIGEIIRTRPDISRRALSLKICDWLNWKSPNGKAKEVSCRVALEKLARGGLVELPPAHRWGNGQIKRESSAEISSEPEPVKCSLQELGKVELVRIGNARSIYSRIWKGLLERYHYLGSGPLCGAQIRYLVKSERVGWIGGLAFSAAAWRLGARDCWIGWDERTRREKLSLVVCNSRFLIPPQVQVPNLASRILSLAVKRLPQDWEERYRITPLLLETFVETGRFTGSSYQAANWQYIGKTQGRGRQDRGRQRTREIKDIYVYPLQRNTRQELCRRTYSDGVQSKKKVRSTIQDWPEEELGHARLGDQRLVRRLVGLLRDFYAQPQASIPQACQNRAKTKAAYRFLEHPKMTLAKVLEPHYESTAERLKSEKIVLSVQDTTILDYSAHQATEDLGPIGNKKDEHVIGLILHDTMAYSTTGVPLGLVDVQCWARDKAGKSVFRKQLPIEQKESFKWLKSYRQSAEMQKRCPGTTLVSVGDREADIFELFDLAKADSAAGGPHILVRARHDRLLGEGQKHLWESVSRQPVSGTQEIKVPRRGNRRARVAKLEVRFSEVRLKEPGSKAGRKLTIWAVLARETNPPEDSEPIEWLLLTTLAVSTFDQAVEKLSWYTIRWSIEIYHRTLKSGCKIEERQLCTADRIETCLAIDMIVAWRIVHLTKLGRDIPNMPCTVYFEESEWKALVAYKTRNPVPAKNPPTLREAIHMVAEMGGYLGRKGDGEPGTKSLWMGLEHLDDITEMWEIMTNTPSYPKSKICIVSSNHDYG